MVTMPQVKPVKGQHIFPANDIKQLALRWKDLIAQDQKDEALKVLEQIILLSTQMFERLAQYEKYHYTVDLPILVSAAQERVPRWLERWEPSKGEIFSWFSKSVTGDTQVVLADGTYRRIDDLVSKHAHVNVRSWNVVEQCFEDKPIIAWHRSPATRKEWRSLSVKHPAGFWRKLFLTHDHEVMTTYGFKQVKDLLQNDTLYLNGKCLTEEGKAALVGMYLGDGCIAKQGHVFSYGHGKKQSGYSKAVSDLFGKKFHEYDAGVSTGKVSKVCIPVLEMWPACRNKFAIGRGADKVNDFVLGYLNEIALAYWYMDDGNFEQNSTTGSIYRVAICVGTLPETSCQALVDQLQHRFSIECSVRQRSTGYRDIYINKESYGKFFDLITPYVVESMRYKVPADRHDAPMRCFEAVRQELIPIDTWKVSMPKGHKKSGSRTGKGFTPDWGWKYDVTVEGNANFLAEGVLVHNCAKNAFRSEVVKVTLHRNRFQASGDNLEKFFGSEDHEINTVDLERELDRRLHQITSRWSSDQHKDSIKYCISCIVSGITKNKSCTIRGAAYAYGISFEQAKFFYTWALCQLRTVCYDMSRIPFSEQDLYRIEYQNTLLVDLLDIVTWDQMKKIIATMGGSRIKVPTVAQLARLAQQYHVYTEVSKSDLDPDSIAEIAAENRMSRRAAQDNYDEFSNRDIVDPFTENFLYDENEE